jgi:hypothetical protein
MPGVVVEPSLDAASPSDASTDVFDFEELPHAATARQDATATRNVVTRMLRDYSSPEAPGLRIH